MADDKNGSKGDLEEALAQLTAQLAETEATNAQVLARMNAAAERDMTARERRAASQRKLQTYHADVEGGRRSRYRTPTRADAEAAEQERGDGNGA